MTACRICGGAAVLSLRATERMLGMGGEFWYDQCGVCGCLQIRDVPANLGAYYGAGYYSLEEPGPAPMPLAVYRRVRDALMFGRARWLGSLVAPLLPGRTTESRDWFRLTHTTRASRVLDVGCGIGLLLRRLAQEGFEHAVGIDPYVETDVRYAGRTLVSARPLSEVQGTFDLVMFHHSLEHIADQLETVRHAARLLRPGGYCLVRIPIVGSYAWEEYRDRWVQLDAPRHLCLHSEESLRRLAATCGLELERVEHDSRGFSLAGSELYRRDLPLAAMAQAGFTRADWIAFERRAHALNKERRGDQAAFYLRKP